MDTFVPGINISAKDYVIEYVANLLFKHKGEFKLYKIINFIAALVHLTNGILSIALASDSGRNISFPVQRTFVGWDTCNSSIVPKNTSYGFGEFIITPASTEQGFTVNLLGLIVSFHMLSFFFQMSVYVTDYSELITERGVNFLRFIEYSISASIMLICIAFISNIVLLPSLVGLFVLSFATMVLGGIAEALFDDILVGDELSGDDTYLKLRRIGWVAHLTGWVTLTAAYGVMIFDNFGLSVGKSNVAVPGFVTFIVIGIFCFYMVFGVIQLCQLCFKDPGMGSLCGLYRPPKEFQVYGMNPNEFVELLYVFNSLTTKTILGWVIISNLLSDEQMSGGPLPTC